MIKTNTHIDLLDDWKFTYGNKNPETFNLNSIEVIGKISNIEGKEIIFQNEPANKISDLVHGIIFKNRSYFLFLTDYVARDVSKVRSYKGLFDLSLKKKYWPLQYELLVGKDLSIITSMILINEENYEELLNTYLVHSDFSFISNNFELYSNNFLEYLTKKYTAGNIFQINYAELISEMVDENSVILRSGSWFEPGIDSIQLFYKKGNKRLQGLMS